MTVCDPSDTLCGNPESRDGSSCDCQALYCAALLTTPQRQLALSCRLSLLVGTGMSLPYRGHETMTSALPEGQAHAHRKEHREHREHRAQPQSLSTTDCPLVITPGWSFSSSPAIPNKGPYYYRQLDSTLGHSLTLKTLESVLSIICSRYVQQRDGGSPSPDHGLDHGRPCCLSGSYACMHLFTYGRANN